MMGELATFNTATEATTTFKNFDSLLISGTDFRTKAAKTLNDELGLLGHAYKPAVKE